MVEFEGRLFVYRRTSEATEVKTCVCHWCNAGQVRVDIADNIYRVKNCVEICVPNAGKIAALKMAQAIVEGFKLHPTHNRKEVYDVGAALFAQHFPESVVHFSSFQKLKSTMTRARADLIPPIPHTYEDVPDFNHWPEELRNSIAGGADGQPDLFLFVAEEFIDPVSGEHQKIVVYASEFDIIQMTCVQTLWIDGTFSVCPEPFEQLVTILTSKEQDVPKPTGEVERRVKLFPRMYCLLPGCVHAPF